MTTANKNDKRDKKPAMQFVHPRLALGCGNAMGAGEIKYGGWNFLLGHGRMQLLAAIERHTAAMKTGELIDADTTALWGATVYHSDCISACLNMMYWQEEFGTIIEDRPIGVIEGVVTFYRAEIDQEESGAEAFSRAVDKAIKNTTIEIGDTVEVSPRPQSIIWPEGGKGRVNMIDGEDDLMTYFVRIVTPDGNVCSWLSRDRITLLKKKDA
jgi:hypothetical protein